MPKIPDTAWEQWPALCLFSIVMLTLLFMGIRFLISERKASREEQEASRQERERERDRSEKIWETQITAVDGVSECLRQHDKQSAERHSATIKVVLETCGRNGDRKNG